MLNVKMNSNHHCCSSSSLSHRSSNPKTPNINNHPQFIHHHHHHHHHYYHHKENQPSLRPINSTLKVSEEEQLLLFLKSTFITIYFALLYLFFFFLCALCYFRQLILIRVFKITTPITTPRIEMLFFNSSAANAEKERQRREQRERRRAAANALKKRRYFQRWFVLSFVVVAVICTAFLHGFRESKATSDLHKRTKIVVPKMVNHGSPHANKNDTDKNNHINNNITSATNISSSVDVASDTNGIGKMNSMGTGTGIVVNTVAVSKPSVVQPMKPPVSFELPPPPPPSSPLPPQPQKREEQTVKNQNIGQLDNMKPISMHLSNASTDSGRLDSIELKEGQGTGGKSIDMNAQKQEQHENGLQKVNKDQSPVAELSKGMTDKQKSVPSTKKEAVSNGHQGQEVQLSGGMDQKTGSGLTSRVQNEKDINGQKQTQTQGRVTNEKMEDVSTEDKKKQASSSSPNHEMILTSGAQQKGQTSVEESDHGGNKQSGVISKADKEKEKEMDEVIGQAREEKETESTGIGPHEGSMNNKEEDTKKTAITKQKHQQMNNHNKTKDRYNGPIKKEEVVDLDTEDEDEDSDDEYSEFSDVLDEEEGGYRLDVWIGNPKMVAAEGKNWVVKQRNRG